MSVLCVVQATVLEEMPPFPERESSILAKLTKKKGPGTVSVTDLEDSKREGGELNGGGERGPDTAAMAASNAVSRLCGASINSISWFAFSVLSCIPAAATKILYCKFPLFCSPPRHHQQTSLGFVRLPLLVLLQPVLAVYWWMCSLRQGLLHLLLL